MRNNIVKVSLLAIALLLSGCGGGGSSSSQGGVNNAIGSLQENVFAVHARSLKQNIDDIGTEVSTTATVTDANVQRLKELFIGVVIEWKSVQATFIAADYSSSLIDTVQLIDFFHTGKKLSVASDIDNALVQGGDIEGALFKNSSKSITALEYLIFGNNESNAALAAKMNANGSRRLAAIKVVISNLQSKISPIVSFYKNNGTFSADTKDASNAVVNTLIDSAFKLKEWRIGEAAGIAVKYKDDSNPTRLEYYNSGLSLESVKSILTTHQDVMGTRAYANFGTFASENGAAAVVTSIRNQLANTLEIANSLGSLEGAISTSRVDAKVRSLYSSVNELQRLYFESLIQSLDLTAEIVEADGD